MAQAQPRAQSQLGYAILTTSTLAIAKVTILDLKKREGHKHPYEEWKLGLTPSSSPQDQLYGKCWGKITRPQLLGAFRPGDELELRLKREK